MNRKSKYFFTNNHSSFNKTVIVINKTVGIKALYQKLEVVSTTLGTSAKLGFCHHIIITFVLPKLNYCT